MGTREKMIVSTALLVREKGARATSIDDVLRHSGAPRGSVYHHFPGGRDELLLEATRYASAFVTTALQRVGDDPLAALDAFISGYRSALLDGDFRPGCPVAAVAVEAPEPGQDGLLGAAGDAFSDWERVIAESYVAAGVDPARARDLATTVLATLEGALILCRARREIAPLDVVHQQLRELIAREIPKETP
jgi:AcrR family transcriptional regulator